MPVSRSVFLELILFAGIAFAARAELATVQIQARVSDETGLPVAAVEVVVRSAGGETQVGHSDEAGNFVMQFAGPGDFQMELSKAGFFRLENQTIHLQEGTNLFSFTLSHEFELHEAIDVIASPTDIQPEQPAAEHTLPAHDILDIPTNKSHDLAGYLPYLPGVVRDNSAQLHLAGGRAGEAEYRLNGFEIGDPGVGTLTSRINVDAVRSVSVETGSYGAEYPHAGAGVIDLETYAGDNRWRFGTTNFLPAFSFQQGIHFGNWFPRFTVSGPLRAGRAWFSEALSVQHSFDLISELPRGSNTSTQWAGDSLSRLQFNLTPRQVLQGDFLVNVERDAHLGLGPFAPLETTSNLRAARYFVSAKDQLTLSDSILEFGVAFDRGRSTRLPLGLQAYINTPAGALGNFFQSLHQQTSRAQWIANWIASSRHWHGAHILRAGFNGDRVALSQQAMRAPIETVDDTHAILDTATFTGSPRFRISNVQAGLYLQDAWRLAAPLLIQAGVRSDWDQLVHRAVVQPRLAASWMPFRDDRAKLTLAWGIYYQPISLALWGQALDQQRLDVFSGTRAGAPPGLPVLTRFSLPPDGLQQPRFHTTSLEWLQKLGPNTLLQIQWIRRVQRLGLAYENVLSGESGNDFVLQNHRRDRFQSLDLSWRRSFRNRAEIFADYTRSRTRSNQVLDYTLESLYFAPQQGGPLAWDAPNRFLSWGWVQTPLWNLMLSSALEGRTGFPYSTFDQQRRLVGPPNQFRFPDFFSLELGVEKRFRFRNHEWAVRFVSVNVTGHKNPDAVNSIAGSPPIFGGGQGRAFTARLRLVGEK